MQMIFSIMSKTIMLQLCCCKNDEKHFKTFKYATSVRFTKCENLTFAHGGCYHL